jgi:dUTP pyrophosphatase
MAVKTIQVILRLLSDLPLPSYQTPGASGLDLYAARNTIIPPGATRAIPTGIALEIPQGYEAQIRPRSGLALKSQIGVLNAPGTVDADYRGEVMVILHNFGPKPFRVKRGARIAQLVFAPLVRARLRIKAQLTPTLRNEGGFGHTG